MSANLDLVRSIYDAWGRGDFSSSAWADAEIEFTSVDGPDPGSWRGIAGMGATNRDFLSVWQDWRVEAEEILELDNERVLVLTRRGGRGKRSGLELWEPAANLFHLRDGRATRLVFYWERERALADLGLTPQGDAT
ncbi:MAG TPA: nuclear transport factor 2 family protein [Solirubrobacteraceae bacterium]|jgi:ketosteroid isomerase-like protein|nr:nuclear transport factor 2 family protein [Solirubrobacteraceae bacterium]